MSRFVSNAVVAVLASVVCTGVVAVAPANAAVPSVFLKLCNKSPKSMYLWVAGKNENGTWTERTNPAGDLGSGACADYTNDRRFATKQYVQIKYRESSHRPQSETRTSTCFIPDVRDGARVRCTLTRF